MSGPIGSSWAGRRALTTVPYFAFEAKEPELYQPGGTPVSVRSLREVFLFFSWKYKRLFGDQLVTLKGFAKSAKRAPGLLQLVAAAISEGYGPNVPPRPAASCAGRLTVDWRERDWAPAIEFTIEARCPKSDCFV